MAILPEHKISPTRKYPYEQWEEEFCKRVRSGEALTVLGFAREKHLATPGSSIDTIRNEMNKRGWTEKLGEERERHNINAGQDRTEAQLAALLRDRKALTKTRREVIRMTERVVKSVKASKSADPKDVRVLRAAAELLHTMTGDVEEQIAEQTGKKGDGKGKFGLARIPVEIANEVAPYATATIDFAPLGKANVSASITIQAGVGGAGNPQDHKRLPDSNVLDASFTTSGNGDIHGALPKSGEADGVVGGQHLVGGPSGEGQVGGERHGPLDQTDRREAAELHRAGQIRTPPGDSPDSGSPRRGGEIEADSVRGSLGTGEAIPQGSESGRDDSEGKGLVEGEVRGGLGTGPGDSIVEDTSGRRGDGIEGGLGEGTPQTQPEPLRSGVGGGVHGSGGAGVPSVHREDVAGGTHDASGSGETGDATGGISTGSDRLGVHGNGVSPVGMGDESGGNHRA